MATVTPERDTVKAQARYVRTSARKARLVLETIRGKSATEAQAILAFHTRAAARDVGKVLNSAIANAENNSGYDAEDMVIVAAYADEGPTLKRWRPRARGRVNRIEKRTCHITIVLAEAEPGEIKRRVPRPTVTKASATAPIAEPEEQVVAEPEATEPAEPAVEETPEAEAEVEEAPAAEEVDEAEAEAQAAEPEAEVEAEEPAEPEADSKADTEDDEEASS
jgi:large subunit ribosomal protein L22